MDIRSRNQDRERTRQFIAAARYAVESYQPVATLIDPDAVGGQSIYVPDEVLYNRQRQLTSPWFVIGGCAILLLCGSGGTLTLDARSVSGGRTVFETPFYVRTEKQKVLSAQDCIRALKNILGLTISDLAQIMMVGRPAIYEWLSGVQPRPKSLERLWQLHGLTQLWSQVSNAPLGNRVHAPFSDGHTLYGLLTSDELGMSDIHRDMRLLANVANQASFGESGPTLSERLRKSGYKRLPEDARAITRQQLGPSWVDEE